MRSLFKVSSLMRTRADLVRDRWMTFKCYRLYRKVFTNDQEEELAAYVAHSAKLYYGLTTSDLHEYAIANNIAICERPSKIIATKGTKQVGAFTSSERGQLITLALAVSASAFVQFARCSQEKPVLLILDNHESHSSIPVLNLCKSNGVVLLSFPPHTSHKLQPLDRMVFGPLKRYFNSSADGWLKSNPGRTINIYDIPLILKPLGLTPKNDDEYFPSEVTNRPINDLAKLNLVESNLTASKENDELRHLTPSP
ncbi:hypothetical protein ILUMI_17210 [Ignelater luminosus]|uniref:DDE-1 domain-containing protein n=1 Tax=Ignelater luminosus TaxID=2038154 RepID=A0A8K0CQW1_IGNLU|nr:hypothetical protein ILUMI_17210 [Ignelater luminosus]